MNSFVHARIELPEIALFWNNALSPRNFRHSLGRQHLALYFKVSVFLGNEGLGERRFSPNWLQLQGSQAGGCIRMERRDYILFTPNDNRKNKGKLSSDCAPEGRLSLKKVFSLLLETCFILNDGCWKMTQVNSEGHSWQISHQATSFHQFKYSLRVFLTLYYLFHAQLLSLFCLSKYNALIFGYKPYLQCLQNLKGTDLVVCLEGSRHKLQLHSHSPLHPQWMQYSGLDSS